MPIIPKIIHQIWIGTKQPPYKLMATWKEKHPDFEYILWNEKEIENRGIIFECQNKIDDIEEFYGKVDIMRWELLYRYGGIFIDADSICIESFDDVLMSYGGFMGFENEIMRPGLIAVGTMAFPKNHAIPFNAIEYIKNYDISRRCTNKQAWETVGPVLLTNIYKSYIYDDVKILPSYSFIPYHYTGDEYEGHGKVYAYQIWGTTRNMNDVLNDITLPEKYNKPEKTFEVVINYDENIDLNLHTIKNQIGHYNMHLTINTYANLQKDSLFIKKKVDAFISTTRFISININ